MREIMFRGIGKDSGKFIYGDLQTYGHKVFIDGAKDRERVDPETVGQYIGLKAFNGVMVYEGDIMEDPYSGQRFVVEWLEEESGFALKHTDSDSYANTIDWLDEGGNYLELVVAGNIFEIKVSQDISKRAGVQW